MQLQNETIHLEISAKPQVCLELLQDGQSFVIKRSIPVRIIQVTFS